MSRRITDLRVILIKAPLAAPIIAPFGTVDVRHNLLVQLHLESGVSGIGEVWANFPPWGCPERVEILRRVVRPALIGETLDDPARLHQKLAKPFDSARCERISSRAFGDWPRPWRNSRWRTASTCASWSGRRATNMISSSRHAHHASCFVTCVNCRKHPITDCDPAQLPCGEPRKTGLSGKRGRFRIPPARSAVPFP